MTPRIALLTALLAIWAATLPANAQSVERMHRIGFLTYASQPGDNEEAFRQGLHELGYIEGQNIVIEWRFTQRVFHRLTKAAAELVRLKVNVIVTGGHSARDTALEATSTIPIVVTVGAEGLVAQGFIASLQRPGGNVTGLSTMSADLIGKQLQIFKEAVPGLSRVAILRNPAYSANIRAVNQAQEAARTLDLDLVSIDRTAAYLDVFRRLARYGVEGVFVMRGALYDAEVQLPGGRTLSRDWADIARLASKSNLPTMFGDPALGRKEGALLAYGPSVPARYRRAATYVDKILKGTNPAEMPVEQPTKFTLVVNLKTARQIGVIFPKSILLRADEVIE